MKFSIKDFFSKCNQIRSFLRIRSHLLKKSLQKIKKYLRRIHNIFITNKLIKVKLKDVFCEVHLAITPMTGF